MKALKTILAMAFIAVLGSCSKDDKTPEVALAPIQDPLQGYLQASGFNQKTTEFKNGNRVETGFSFMPLVKGKITAIVVKIPDVQSGIRVTIWDKATTAIIRTESIDITSSGIEVIKPISAIDLVQDKEYFITMNSDDVYSRKKTDGSAVTYPFVIGDIKITSYGFVLGATQKMPDNPFFLEYSGDISFKFQK
jgi:hypothetical protein